MSIQYGQFCPIAKAAEVLGERWTILIVRELLLGTTRFNELQRALSQISPSLLTKRLVQLQDYGLVIKKEIPAQRRSEYYLTAAGKELKPVVMGLGEWGSRWARGQMEDNDLDVELLMIDLQRRIDTDALPAGPQVFRFTFDGLNVYPHWWIVLDGNGGRELCVDNPGKPADVSIVTNLRTMTEIWAGDTSIREAKNAGTLRVSGNPVLLRTISSWLRSGMFSDVRPATLGGK
jgi:DNA-binding HxlR family transcriptional regulator|uniref:winged helix-turn-helix transcriptional regulator n=1 Tax=Cephaloticoccus sp. TaxID=1985742 RepID=UPI004049E73E